MDMNSAITILVSIVSGAFAGVLSGFVTVLVSEQRILADYKLMILPIRYDLLQAEQKMVSEYLNLVSQRTYLTKEEQIDNMKKAYSKQSAISLSIDTAKEHYKKLDSELQNCSSAFEKVVTEMEDASKTEWLNSVEIVKKSYKDIYKKEMAEITRETEKKSFLKKFKNK